jgi:UDP-glucose 4-epimerase
VARYLVTGGAGFIGSHVAAALAKQHEVVVLDNFSSGTRANLAGVAARVVEGDVRDARSLAKACEGVEAVFHLAAQISVAGSMERPAATVEVNTVGTLALIEAARRAGAGAIVLSSSAAIYGDDPRLPKRESMAPDPRSPYAVSKLDGEYYLRIFAAPHGMRAAALRYFNVFGPRQDPRSQYAAAIPAFISRAVAGEPITIFGDGKQTRDFVFVEDVARANLLAAGVLPAAGRGAPPLAVYNVGGGRSISILALARAIIRATGSSSRIVHADPRPGDVRHSRGDVSLIRRDLGFRAGVPLAEGLRRTIESFRAAVGA